MDLKPSVSYPILSARVHTLVTCDLFCYKFPPRVLDQDIKICSLVFCENVITKVTIQTQI